MVVLRLIESVVNSITSTSVLRPPLSPPVRVDVRNDILLSSAIARMDDGRGLIFSKI